MVVSVLMCGLIQGLPRLFIKYRMDKTRILCQFSANTYKQ